MSYGANSIDLFRQAAGYVDRVLKGEKPADLAVQAPSKNELVINLKSAKAIGLTVPPSVNRPRLARADMLVALTNVRLRVQSGHHKITPQCPLLAQSGHELVRRTCPLLGVKRT